MRNFEDSSDSIWIASIREREGDDYKGRFLLVLNRDGGSREEEIVLKDVCWNSPKTAERTLRTMSRAELRRRLHSALGRVV